MCDVCCCCVVGRFWCKVKPTPLYLLFFVYKRINRAVTGKQADWGLKIVMLRQQKMVETDEVMMISQTWVLIIFLFCAFSELSLHVLWNTRLSAQPSDRPKKKAQTQRDEIFIDFMMCMQEAIFSAQDWTWVYPMEVCVCVCVWICRECVCYMQREWCIGGGYVRLEIKIKI